MLRKIWKVTKLALLTLVALLVVLLAGGLAYRAYRHHQIARATVIDPAKGVDEAFFARIGGIEQWISIRGQDRDNPVLLFLHGGPGVATSPYPRDVLFSWTKDFTFVQWDQRGSGKTYGRSGPLGADVTIDRMAQDGIELAEFLRQHLQKKKIIVLGLSWGTTVGVYMAKARPDLFYSYVGTGQIVNARESETITYRQVLEKARARGDREAIKELEQIGPPPYASQAAMGVQRNWGRAYEPGLQSNLSLISTILLDSDAGFRDLRDYIRGISDSQDHFIGVLADGPSTKIDLPALGTDFAIPMFVFEGAEDDVAPAGPARAYLESMVAPQKQFVAIANAGHTAMYTRSDEFLRLLDENVRPLAIAGR
jgi:pimeloyl-ACP methyl ester carboxylesterase